MFLWQEKARKVGQMIRRDEKEVRVIVMVAGMVVVGWNPMRKRNKRDMG